MIATREAASRAGLSLEGARLVIQGYGNVGYVAARLLTEQGCTLVAAADSTSAIYSGLGLDAEALKSYKNDNGSLSGYKGADATSSQELLELSCDILIPAALERQIDGANAGRIKAKVVVEGANGPVTPEADAILNDRGVLVVPDILANAGGGSRVLFRVGAGHPAVFLGYRRDQPQDGIDHGQQLCQGHRDSRDRTGKYARGRNDPGGPGGCRSDPQLAGCTRRDRRVR